MIKSAAAYVKNKHVCAQKISIVLFQKKTITSLSLVGLQPCDIRDKRFNSFHHYSKHCADQYCGNEHHSHHHAKNASAIQRPFVIVVCVCHDSGRH